MKPYRIAIAIVLCLGLAALAQSNITRILNLVVQNQMLVGTTTSTGNKVTKMLGGSGTLDFISATTTCNTTIADGGTSAITVTGAAVGDPCFVGAPSSPAANSSFTCYVSATDTVTVKQCAAGTASDPSSGTYYVRVISSQ